MKVLVFIPKTKDIEHVKIKQLMVRIINIGFDNELYLKVDKRGNFNQYEHAWSWVEGPKSIGRYIIFDAKGEVTEGFTNELKKRGMIVFAEA